MEVVSSRFSRTRKYFSLPTLFIMAGFIFHGLAHKIDYTRVIYKRLKAPDPYTYERVAPAILAIDPGTKINKEVITNPSQIREALVSTFWGQQVPSGGKCKFTIGMNGVASTACAAKHMRNTCLKLWKKLVMAVRSL